MICVGGLFERNVSERSSVFYQIACLMSHVLWKNYEDPQEYE